MLDLILLGLLQAVAGDPVQPAQASPQASEAPAAQAETAQSAAQPAAEEVRCRREPILGTRLSRRICTTAAQDEAMAEEARSMVNRAQSQMTTRD